ncbi:MAG: hypothetical protein ACTSUS_06040, partial [Candidatus Freyarchaeota archaeon]
LTGDEEHPAVFQANGNITIGAVYDENGELVRGCLSQQAGNMYMKIDSSASNAGGYIGDPLGFNRIIKSDTRTAIKVTQGTLTIYTQEYSSALELLNIQIGATANVIIRINSTHVTFDIDVPGDLISEEWVADVNYVDLTSYGGVANFSKLAEDRKLPTIRFWATIIPVQTLDLDDLIALKATENNHYIDVISMEWGSGTVWEAWTGPGINPMALSDGSVVLLNNSEFVLESNSSVMMTFSGGSAGVPVGLKVNGSSGAGSPLVHIEALSLFADSWGSDSYMWIRGAKRVFISNAEISSECQEVGEGALLSVEGSQLIPLPTIVVINGLMLTGSLVLSRDYGAVKSTFIVNGSISMPSGQSYISADLVNLSGDSVISGEVFIDGRLVMVGSLTSTGDSDINGVNILRNATMEAVGRVELEGSQSVNGSLSMSSGGMLVNASGIFVTGDTVISGSLEVSGVLTVTGDLSMEGDIEIGVSPFTSMNVKGSITLSSGYASISDDGVSMAGESNVINGLVNISGKNVIDGSLTSTGDSDINGVSILRNATMSAKGTVEVEGSQLINGSLSMSSSATDINASGIFISGDVSVDGGLTVNGSLTIKGDVTMEGGVVEMRGSSAITGSVEMSGSVNTNNLMSGTVQLRADRMVMDGVTVIRDGKVEVVDGVLKVTDKGTEISCSVKISGDISSTGILTLSNVEMNGATFIVAPTLTLGSTLVRGLMQILLNPSLLTSMLTNPMLTLGQVMMAQSLIYGSVRVDGDMTVAQNGVIISGSTQITGMLNAFNAPSMNLGSIVSLSSSSAVTSTGLLPLPSLSIAITTPLIATLALVGLVVARVIVPPVAIAAGRGARRIQKRYFAPETRAYMVYYRSRTYLSKARRRLSSTVRAKTRAAASRVGEGFYRVWSIPANKMASIELFLARQRMKIIRALPIRVKAWLDRVRSTSRRRFRVPRIRVRRG